MPAIIDNTATVIISSKRLKPFFIRTIILYPTAFPMLKIGIYKAIINIPIIPPINTIISGSIIDDKAATTLSNSSS